MLIAVEIEGEGEEGTTEVKLDSVDDKKEEVEFAVLVGAIVVELEGVSDAETTNNKQKTKAPGTREANILCLVIFIVVVKCSIIH